MKFLLEALLVTLFHFIPLYSTLYISVDEKNDGQFETADEMIEGAYSLKKISASGVLTKQIQASSTKVLASNIMTENLGARPRTARPSAAPTTRAVSMPKQASISPDITYHGNRSVMVGQVNLYNIYVGAFSNLADPSASLVNYFASNIGNTSWFGILPKHYYQYKNKVKKYISSTGPKFKKGVVAQAALSSFKGVRDFVNIILNQFNKGTLVPDTNGLYTIVFRGTLPAFSEAAAGKWLRNWCGLHAYFTLNNIEGTFKFAVIGDPFYNNMPDGYLCQASDNPPNKNMGGDSIVNIYAHELAEMYTNPNLFTWYINNEDQHEVADACGWSFGTYTGNSNVVVAKKKFLIQELWIPGRGCALSG